MTAVKPNTVKVEIDDRIFFVDFDDNKKVLRIKERKKGELRNSNYWNARFHGGSGSEKTMASRIIKKALET